MQSRTLQILGGVGALLGGRMTQSWKTKELT